MILFIFEGKNDEPRLYKTLKEIFHFELNEEEIIHYYCNNIFSLYDCETGELTRTTREACEGLERCSIWYDNHIEDRIYAHYANIKCEWLISIDEWIKMNQKK